ncbi:hypothetical protein KR50_23270 [Jeotgalibacillus campisalis]|uniref:Sin domain-containing protein n=1 Tax=Jeotgalibacillus campisalis TaxID=220754 RepID=A0A0C2R9N5_9BACL|nr:hypothetical protein KR50_23270 [Jeotgalibacillus campisalis]
MTAEPPEVLQIVFWEGNKMGRAAEVDLEWVALINEALMAGISECEIEDFLKGKNLHRERERRSVAVG